MDARDLKEKAAEAFAKGRFSRAAELYEQYCASDPKDLQARLRMGDAFAKSGEREQAIHAYQGAAEGFAQSGFLPRAIAASKLILELDPSHKGVQGMLAGLYARRGLGGPGAARRPVEGGGPTLQTFSPSPAGRRPPNPGERADAIDLPPEEPPMVVEPNSVTAEPLSPGAGAAGPSAGSSGSVDFSSELPPELAIDAGSRAPAAPAASPEEEEGADIEIDVDEASMAPAMPVAAAPAAPLAAPVPAAVPPVAAAPVATAPPGLRPKRASVPPPGSPVEQPAAIPAARNAVDPVAAPRFDELDLEMAADSLPGVLSPANAAAPSPDSTELEREGDSLLHTVELAAGDPRVAEQAEEVVFSTEDLAEPSHSQALPKIPLFSDLPAEAFIALFERCPLRRFPRGASILQQGSHGDSFFVICDGSVRVFREEEGGRKELAILQDGAFFGEVALLSDAPRTASVESASDETQLLEISAQVLAELSHSYPLVAQALKKFCRQRLLQNVMGTSALFRPFDRKDRRQLIERFRARDVPRGTPLIREGEQSDGLYVVMSGEVEVRKDAQLLARLKEGDIFGEMSLLQKTPATATVVAAKRTSLLRLPREDFDELILSHPQILILISELTEDRRRQTEAVLGGAAVHGEQGLLLI